MSKGELWIEKRRDRRLDLSFPVIYSLLSDGADGGDKEAKGSNISRGGIRLVTREELKPGALLRVKIILPDELPAVKGKAEVVWRKKRGKQGDEVEYHLGLKFTELESRGQDLVSRFMEENLKKLSGL